MGPNEVSEFFKVLAGGAKDFGALEASSVWALIFIVMFWERQQIRKQQTEQSDQWLETRTAQAISETKTAEAIDKLAEQVDKNTDQVSRLSILIDERIRRRDV